MHKPQVGYSEFVQLCNVFKPTEFYCGVRLEKDGVYIIEPDSALLLFPDERAALSEHPLKDLTKPALAFPCTFDEFIGFMTSNGMEDRISQTKLRLLQKENNVKTAKSNTWDEHVLRRLVAEAREPSMTQKKLGEKYGVSASRIGTLLRRQKISRKPTDPFASLRSKKK